MTSKLIAVALTITLVSTWSACNVEASQPIVEDMRGIPLVFTKNMGQWDEAVKFRTSARGAVVWICKDKVVFQFLRKVDNSSFEVQDDYLSDSDPKGRIAHQKDSVEQLAITANFVGANPDVAVIGEGLLEYKCNYFIGNDPSKWRTDVPNFETVTLKEIYPGMNLRLSSDQEQQLAYEFVLSEEETHSVFKIAYDGISKESTDHEGRTHLSTEWGDVLAPFATLIDRDTSSIPESRQVTRSQTRLAAANASAGSPGEGQVVLSFCTYLGGNGEDTPNGLAVDPNGGVYVIGVTLSNNFPLKDPFQTTTHEDYGQAFVTKLAPTGDQLEYSTYLGGESGEEGYGIAVDNSGSAYVTGVTGSTDFPLVNAFDGSLGGSDDAFVTKLSPSGNVLLYSTYLGGSDHEWGFSIAVGESACATVVGHTSSVDFPVQNAFDESFNGPISSFDAFVTRLSIDGTSLLYSTFLGGFLDEKCVDIALDRSECAYVTGPTRSFDFPTYNPFQANMNSGRQAFVTKLSPTGNALIFSTFLGGTEHGSGTGIAVDSFGCSYVTGWTRSIDFPTLSAYDASFNGGQFEGDVFVTKLSPLGNTLEYSTYLGGEWDDAGAGIAVDNAGCAYVTGWTGSSAFPIRGAYGSGHKLGRTDAFVTKLSPSGNALEFSSYLGGTEDETAFEIVLDSANYAILTGRTWSDDFPTESPFDGTYEYIDAFVARLCYYTDLDGDGIVDPSDNCPLVPNSNQLDANSNGFGDACECAPSYTATASIAGDGFGTAVSTAGDVDGVGADDIVVGAPMNDQLAANAGRAYVISGVDGSLIWTLGSATGNPAGEQFGTSIDGGSDITGDAVPDIVVGARYNSTQASQAGAATVFSGASGAAVTVESGYPTASNWLGTSVAVLGQVDGDALSDYAGGAPNKSEYGSGTVYVIQGTNGSGGAIIDTINGLAGDYLGSSLAAVGDVDGDGHADILVGAYGTSAAVPGRAGVYSIFPTDSLIFGFVGEANGDQFGRSVAGGGDYNNDGINDFIVGAPFNAAGGFQAGRVYVYSGQDGGLLTTLTGAANENFGWSVSFVEDINHDGFDEVAVSSPGENSFDGLVQIFGGGSGLLLYAMPAPTPDALAGWAITGQPDCDGDGSSDLVVGAPMASPTSAGRAFVYFLGDSDNDGLIALKDNCPYAYNPLQTDTDADSIGDACDECVDIAVEPWQFGNSGANMWPQSWWQQFSYCYPNSPCEVFCILCQSSSFPNWDLFVSAIGEDQAYFDPPPGEVTYRPSALAEWEALRGAWTGSCFGFAAGSSLFFDDLLEVGTVFPGYSSLNEVPLSGDSRSLINKLYLYQFGYYQQERINDAYNTTTPSQTLSNCKEMFNRTPRNDQVLMMFNQAPSGGHAVVPYRCLQDGSNPALWYIYAHDSNLPEDTTQRVTIDLSADTWSYTGLPGWGGDRGLFLLDSVSNYTAPLVLTDTAEATNKIAFLTGQADSAVFESAAGTIGFDQNGTYGSVVGGSPIIPVDGTESSPIGYFLPTGEWYHRATGVVDGVFTVVDGQKRIFRYGGAKSGIISAAYRPNLVAPSLTSYGVDGKSGRGIYDSIFIEVISISPDTEVVVQLSGLEIPPGDSVTLSLTPEQQVQFDNYGSETSYDLLVQIVSEVEDTTFYTEEVTIGASTSHLITPDWRPENDSIVIAIDTSMTGDFDDSVMVVPSVQLPQFVCGDADGTGIVTISDAVYLINYIFGGGPAPAPVVRGDADCNGIVTISDAVYLINYIFGGGAAPCAACP